MTTCLTSVFGDHVVVFCGHVFVCSDLAVVFNLSNAELNPICQLLALLGSHRILHISRIRVNNFFLQLVTLLLYY